MGNIERGPVTIKVCPVDGKPVNQWLSCDEHHRWAVDGEFVPAEQLRGAVEALEEIADTPYDEPRQMHEIAQAALDRLGGQ